MKDERIQSAWTCCVPSLGGESFGVVLLEAMAAGVPVVASDLEAYRLTARGGRDAILTATGDAAALAQGLAIALDGGPEVAERIRSGRERAASLSMDHLGSLYLDRYRGILDPVG